MDNAISFHGDTAAIWLKDGDSLIPCFVDAPVGAKLKRISTLTWFLRQSKELFYAVACRTRRPGEQEVILMHRLLARPGIGQQVDHIDGDGLNNRAKNLRVVSPRENSLNRHTSSRLSGTRGVVEVNGKFAAYAKIGGKKYLGTFQTKADATEAVQRALLEAGVPAIGVLMSTTDIEVRGK